jgi:hypothetical protein
MAGKGGAMPGAGRKSNASKLLAAGFIAPYFGAIEQERHWKSLLASDDEKIRMDAVKYLTDRLYGKAPQSMELKGEMDVVTRVVSDL